MDDFRADGAFIRREKEKARQLRSSPWWKNRRSNGICHYCGRHFPPRELTMDHLVPIARGGRSTKGNLVPCCKECNTRKNTMLPLEWAEYVQRFSAPSAGSSPAPSAGSSPAPSAGSSPAPSAGSSSPDSPLPSHD
ncbi:MAG: HNH endonuclease [Oligosphaeraceae bacterium]